MFELLYLPISSPGPGTVHVLVVLLEGLFQPLLISAYQCTLCNLTYTLPYLAPRIPYLTVRFVLLVDLYVYLILHQYTASGTLGKGPKVCSELE